MLNHVAGDIFDPWVSRWLSADHGRIARSVYHWFLGNPMYLTLLLPLLYVGALLSRPIREEPLTRLEQLVSRVYDAAMDLITPFDDEIDVFSDTRGALADFLSQSKSRLDVETVQYANAFLRPMMAVQPAALMLKFHGQGHDRVEAVATYIRDAGAYREALINHLRSVRAKQGRA